MNDSEHQDPDVPATEQQALAPKPAITAEELADQIRAVLAANGV
ncbi:hypothetical protein [Streptomyces mexicanus]